MSAYVLVVGSHIQLVSSENETQSPTSPTMFLTAEPRNRAVWWSLHRAIPFNGTSSSAEVVGPVDDVEDGEDHH